ncbi:MAG: translocation/assembly module TamB [Treponema sp.]|nr:translocation/assembly module TamB [Treponema sp.]
MKNFGETGAKTRITMTTPLSGAYSLAPHIIIFAFLVALSAFALYPVHKMIRERTETLRDDFILMMEGVLRRKIEYGAMGPSPFGTIDIRDIRVSGGERIGGSEPGEQVIRVSRMRVSWSLLKLLRQEPGFIRAVRLDRPAVHFDYRRDQDLLELFSNPSWYDWEKVVPKGMGVRIRNGSFTFKAPESGLDADFLLDKLYLDVSFDDEGVSVQGKWNLNFSLTGQGGDPFNAASAGRVSGSWSFGLREGTALVNMPFFAGDFFRLGALGLRVSLKDNRIEARKITDRSPLDISLDYSLDTRELAASFRCEDFSLRDLVSLSGDFRDFNSWLAVRNTGSGSFSMDGKGGIRYGLDLLGKVPRNLPAANSSFAVKAWGDKNYIRFDRLSLELSSGPARRGSSRGPGGAIRFYGGLGLKPLAPNGTITLSNFSLKTEPLSASGPGSEPPSTVNAELTVSTRGKEIGISGSTVFVGDVELAAFGISLYPEASGLGFDLSALGLQDEGSISLGGTIAYKPRQLEVYCRLDSFSALDLVNMAEPFTGSLSLAPLGEALARETMVTTDIFASTDFEHIFYNLPQTLVLYQGMGEASLRFSASGTDQRFDLIEGRIKGSGQDEVLLAGHVDFPNSQYISFSLNGGYKDMSYPLEGEFLDGRLNIRGSYGFNVSIGAGLSGYSGSVQAVDIPIPIRSQMARLEFSTSLRYESQESWSIEIEKLNLKEINLPGSPAAAMSVSGRADQNGASFSRLLFDDGMGQLSGEAAVEWNSDFSDLRGKFNISGEEVSGEEGSGKGGSGKGGSEVYQGEGSWRNRNLDIFLSGTGMRLFRILENVSAEGRDSGAEGLQNYALADGNVRLNWNQEDSFRIELELSSLNIRNRDTEIEASFLAFLDKDEFSLRNIRVKLAGLEGEIPLFTVRRQDNWAGGAGRIEGLFAGRTVAMSFKLDSRFAGVDSWLKISQALSDFQGKLSVWDIRMDVLESEQVFDFVFSRQGSLVSLSGGPGEMIRFRLGEGGIFYAGFSHPSPIRGSVAGTISPSEIDARAGDIYIDLAALWHFIPVKTELEALGGYVTASLDIRGSLGDPEFFGRARGNSIRIRIPRFVDADIRPVPVDVLVEGNEMRFGPVPAACGGGSGLLSGWFQFDRWIPNIFSIDIAVPGGSPIPVKFDIQGVLVRGIVSGNLDVSMENRNLMIDGDLTAQETEISLDAAELARAQEEDMWDVLPIPVTADIMITAGRRVEFLWPTRNFPMLRAYADMGAGARITVDTSGRRFSFTGDIDLRSGEIFYFERNFFIRSGTLSFNENEQQFNPRISARAEAKDRTNEGPVTISMVVDNAPLLSFQARFESSPALSQMEILSLLGQSITGSPDSAEGGTINNAFLASSADLFTQFQVVRRMERTIRDFLRLDMFSIRTQVLQNYVFRAIGLEKDPVDRIASVGNYFDNTSVYVGKYIGSDMFIQSMVSLRYDETKPNMGGYTFEPDFGVELRSPLGNIRWNLVPTHPENWYISDNSFTISWNWVF